MNHFYKWAAGLAVAAVPLCCAQGQTFTKNTLTGFEALTDARATWADFNNDQYLDLLVTGVDGLNKAKCLVYINDGKRAYNTLGLEGFFGASFALADLNKDGYIDIAISGVNSSGKHEAAAFLNDKGLAFNKVDMGWKGLSNGALLVADLNSDTFEDVLVSGYDDKGNLDIQFYRNDGGSFTSHNLGLGALGNGQFALFDANNDGAKELLVSGANAQGGPTMKIYSISPGLALSVYNNNLPGYAFHSLDMGDYNSDGFADLAITGLEGNGLAASSQLYGNNTVNGLAKVAPFMANLSSSSIGLGDLDNDGLVDIVLTGIDGTGNKYFKCYRNSPSHTFTEVALSLENTYRGDVAIGDHDNDGDLDLFQVGSSDLGFTVGLYESDMQSTAINTAPSTPANLSSATDGASVTLSWDKATGDDHTPGNSLSYNVYLSLKKNGDGLAVSPLSDLATGYRMVCQAGNAGYQNRFSIDSLPDGKYYWGVQTIDNGWKASAFSAVDSFTICNGPHLADVSVCAGDIVALQAGSAGDVANWYSLSTGAFAQNPTTNLTFELLRTDTIAVEIIRPYGCTAYDTLIAEAFELPAKTLPGDTAVCEGSALFLEVQGYDSVNWHSITSGLLKANAFDIKQTILAPDSWVAEVYNGKGCVNYDTVDIAMHALPMPVLPSDTSICYREGLGLQLSGFDSVNWYTTNLGLLFAGNDRFKYAFEVTDTIIGEVFSVEGCVDYGSTIVHVVPLPQASIGSDTSICFKETLPISIIGVDSVNWYSMKDGALSHQKQVVHTAHVQDTLVAEYYNAFGCVNYDSLVVGVYGLPTIDVGKDTAICHKEHLLLEAGAQLNSVYWTSLSSGDTLKKDSWFMDYQVMQTDTILVQASDLHACTNYDTIMVKDLGLPNITLGPDQEVCFGQQGKLEVNGSWKTVAWYTGKDILLGPNNPSYEWIVEESLDIRIEVQDQYNCMNYDTVSITVLALPTFELDTKREYCHGGSVALETADGTADRYSWTLKGKGEISTTHKVAFIAETSDTLTLVAHSSKGCSYSDTSFIQVNPLPVFHIEGDSMVCAHDTAQLSISYPGWTSIRWYDSDTLARDVDVAHYAPAHSRYIYALLTDSKQCSNLGSQWVETIPRPVAGAGNDTLLCHGEHMVLGTGPEDGENSYAWSPSTYLDDSTKAQPLVSPIETATYTLQVANKYGCTSRDTIMVGVLPQIHVNAGGNKELCIGDTLLLGGSPTVQGGTASYTYTWAPATYLDDASIANPAVVPDTTTRYVLEVKSGRCATERDTVLVAVHPLPVIEVIPDQSIGLGEHIELYARGGVGYLWSPEKSLDGPTTSNPVATPVEATRYTVTVWDEHGCASSGTVLVRFQNSLFIPSLFTPNGDGENDVFKLYGSGAKTIKLAIYTPQGQRVFYADQHGQAFETGWDGSYNGQAVPDGTYIWTIEGSYKDGTPISYEGQRSGTITILK